MKQKELEIEDISVYMPARGEERLKILRKLKGMWKNRKPDPIKEWEVIRASWDRDLSNIK